MEKLRNFPWTIQGNGLASNQTQTKTLRLLRVCLCVCACTCVCVHMCVLRQDHHITHTGLELEILLSLPPEREINNHAPLCLAPCIVLCEFPEH
jgi:hypothetical protein